MATHYDIYEFYDTHKGPLPDVIGPCTPRFGIQVSGAGASADPSTKRHSFIYAWHGSEVVAPRGRRHRLDGISQHIDQATWSWLRGFAWRSWRLFWFFESCIALIASHVAKDAFTQGRAIVPVAIGKIPRF